MLTQSEAIQRFRGKTALVVWQGQSVTSNAKTLARRSHHHLVQEDDGTVLVIHAPPSNPPRIRRGPPRILR